MIDHVMRRDDTQYNAAVDLIERNVAAGRGGKTVCIDAAASTNYAQLAERVDRRWIEFLSELPKTATGKIQRFAPNRPTTSNQD
jgi:acyl-CoA synthetase (AMP-forming)/AMP-acid ligase II